MFNFFRRKPKVQINDVVYECETVSINSSGLYIDDSFVMKLFDNPIIKVLRGKVCFKNCRSEMKVG